MGPERFPGRPRLEWLGPQQWRLLEDYVYHSSAHGMITVPAGFVTDGASVPPPLWALLPPDGPYFGAAIVHDFLYRGHAVRPGTPVDRSTADSIFHDAMVDAGVGWCRRWAVYVGVRLGGWMYWQEAGA